MSDTPEQPESSSKRDARLKTFLRRAAPVIAAERGLTSAARIKLQTIAAEMRLPGELLDEALTELQTESQKGRHYSRWERGFAKFLADQLKKLDNRILTFDREQKAIRVGEEKYQLTHPQAREIITEVAKQLGIRRISASEAERHVETTIKEKVGQGVWIDVESRERLFMLGEEWGLSKEHVAAVIDHYIRSNKDRRSNEQRRSSLLVAAIGVVFLGLLATILYVGVQYSLNPTNTETSESDPDSKGGSNADGTFSPPNWWNERLTTSVATAIGNIPSFKAYVAELASDDIAMREAGYQKLSAEWMDSFDEREKHNRLEAVLRDCLVLDPEPEVTRRLFDSILQAARPPQTGLPSGSDFYRRGMSLIEFACRLLDQDNLEGAKKEEFREQLDQITGTFLTTLPGGKETIERYQSDYLQRLFDQLIEYAGSDPSLSLDRFDQLRRVGSSLISDADQRRWATELLVELIRIAPDSWKQYQGLMQLCITPSNRDHLPALLDLLEFSTVPSLARELAGRFHREFNLDVDEGDPLKIAAAMRRELGITRSTTGRQASGVWTRLAAQAQERLKKAPDIAPNATTAQEIVDLFFLGNQAAQLALRPDDAQIIQQAITNGSPALESEATTTGLPIADPRIDDRDLDRLVGRLSTLNDVSVASAMSTIRAVGERISSGNDLSSYTSEAQALARYLLVVRAANDQKRLLGVIDPLKNWSELLLAIADELDQPGTSLEQGINVISTLLNLDLVLDGTGQGPDALRRKLLERALTQLSSTRSTVDDQPLWNRLQQQAFASIDQRCALFDFNTPRSPSQLPGEAMVGLVEAFYEWSTSQTPSLAQEAEYQDCLRRLAASSYQANDDLQRTVAAQQILMDLVFKWIEVTQISLRPQVQQIRKAYYADVIAREEVVNQLIDGEQAWLKSWLLLRQ
jgi:hypothetical protein